MAKGQPDFGQYAPTETIVGLSDMGELAARLKSISTFDRRGNVIFLDDFEDGIVKWGKYSAAGGGSVEWDATRARNGGFCAKLSTGGSTDDDASAFRNLPYPKLSKIGGEVSVSLGVYLKTILWMLRLDSGTSILEAKVRWTKATKTWACDASGAGWTDLAPITTLETSVVLFHTFKLVCDFPNQRYDKLVVNNTIFDLSALVIPSISPGDAPYLRPRLEITTPSNNAGVVYFDDIIITQNEP